MSRRHSILQSLVPAGRLAVVACVGARASRRPSASRAPPPSPPPPSLAPCRWRRDPDPPRHPLAEPAPRLAAPEPKPAVDIAPDARPPRNRDDRLRSASPTRQPPAERDEIPEGKAVPKEAASIVPREEVIPEGKPVPEAPASPHPPAEPGGHRASGVHAHPGRRPHPLRHPARPARPDRRPQRPPARPKHPRAITPASNFPKGRRSSQPTPSPMPSNGSPWPSRCSANRGT